jgi:hypothetical protein
MALIVEAGRARDLNNGKIGGRKFPASEFNPELPKIVSHRAAVRTSECPGEMGRVYSNRCRNVSDG